MAVIDPHGDLIDDVMAHIPSRRTNDVILFDVSDLEYPVGFNIMQYKDASEKNLVVSGMMAVFARIWEGSWSSRMEYILRNVLMSVIEYPNATLMHVIRVMTDEPFKKEVLSYVTDAVVLKFWKDEYDKWQDKYKSEAVAPIINKIGQFLSSPIVRNIFGQPQTKMSLREAMDEGKIILINLSKGKIGEDNASMIGSFLVTKFQIDAMSRADLNFKDRKDFYLYIDEFQNFATDSFASILSEARKYRLSLIVANQFTSQIQENVRDAIFGNVGTIVSFGLGYDDATIMSSQFKEIVTPNDLISLPKFKAYIKLMVDGVTTDSFSMATFPLPQPDASAEIKDKIRLQSRQRYSMEREKLEKLLKVRAEKEFTPSEKIAEKAQKE
ncbi:MAG: TraM recognition domain-containing protein [Candidatus Peribacteria bacterium]|nr:MAG: TraM recognition domain-containing protein [Candidatus Peribacteria bacterium]